MSVKAENLEFRYEGEFGKSAFHLSVPEWNIEAGDFVCLPGPAGCGKSTLLKLIFNIFEHKNGTIKIEGKDIKDLRRKELAGRIAFVPQKNFTIFIFFSL